MIKVDISVEAIEVLCDLLLIIDYVTLQEQGLAC
jgi:hypothetical protein